jgi:hypothetical protein
LHVHPPASHSRKHTYVDAGEHGCPWLVNVSHTVLGSPCVAASVAPASSSEEELLVEGHARSAAPTLPINDAVATAPVQEKRIHEP